MPFRIRALAVLVLAVGAATNPSLGSRHGLAAAGLLLVLPYNVALERRARATGAFPRFMPHADQALALVLLAVLPSAWTPALAVMTACVAFAAAAYPRGTVVGVACASVATASVIGGLTQPYIEALAGSIGFAAACAVAIFPVAGVARRERDLRAENAHLVQSIDASVRAAEEERALYSEVVEHIETALLVARHDQDHDDLVVVAANPAAARVLGADAPSLVGRPLMARLGGLDPSILQRARGVAGGADSFTLDRLEGVGTDPQRIHSLQVFGLPGAAVGLAFDDVTSAAMVAAALRRQALHDGLTGLPNRTLLRDRLEHALIDARRRKERLALILMDLNHFKEVNDALGHQYGDRLLTAFSSRLQTLLRECDTIARLGGDEFALLITNATNEGASRVVAKVTEAMQEPFELDGVTVQTTASMGVALFPDHADDADLLTRRADVAMYTAKRGGGGWAIYSPQHDQSSVERLTLLSELHRQLESPRPEGLELHYQPILDLHRDQISGAEALLRWHHPTYGQLSPELVVELAALSGLIQPLARAIARRALDTCRSWTDHGDDMRISINLAARNLYDRHLITWLRELLEVTGVRPDQLKCELTESEVMDDPVLAMDVLSQLRDIGVQTSIDDFGTGYSSLSYLRRLPVDEIKIDKSFVMSMRMDRNDLTIVKTVIDLVHNLGKDVVAEGVEDHETLAMLRDMGCDRVQGYLIGRPVAREQFWSRLPSVTGPVAWEAPATAR